MGAQVSEAWSQVPKKPFVLTEKGKTLVKQIQKAKQELKSQLCKNISQEECETFGMIVDKILANAQALKEKKEARA